MKNKIKIYHFSNKELKIISPDYFGDNCYSLRDKKYNVKRSFFYLEDNPKEYHLKGKKYCYISEVEKSKLYDLRIDKDNLKSKFIAIDELLEFLKTKYIGIIYNVGFDIVSLFYDIDILNTKEGVK